MSKTNVIPQVEAEQVKNEATKKRYAAYVQCVHQLEAEAGKKADAGNDEIAEDGGRA